MSHHEQTLGLRRQASILQQQGDLEAAIAAYRNALEIEPNHAGSQNNLGVIFLELGAIAEAIQCFCKALQLQPAFAGAHVNLAHALLLTGHYERGWAEYEWRSRKHPPTLPHAIQACRRWHGGPLEREARILLVSEQGLGDTLQFMRYIKCLRRPGLQVSLAAPPKLHGLIRSAGLDPAPQSPEVVRTVREGYWLPLLSLPRHLGVSLENPLINQPYLQTDPHLKAKWRTRLANEPRPIIGLNWQGNPRFERPFPEGRSLQLETLQPIAAASTGSLVSLQKGAGSEQLQHCSFRQRFVRCQADLDAQAELDVAAAVIANCDLVITSDTAMAHLAGALGATTWLLLKKVPDWRWGLEGSSCGWYDSLRLFRQSHAGDWSTVIAQVTEALQKWATGTSHSVITAPISLGELVDKITILRIKLRHVQGSARDHVIAELQALEHVLARSDLNLESSLIEELKSVNEQLWRIEDALRDLEGAGRFDDRFVALARSVYQHNDQRAALKRTINLRYGSALIEEKCYSTG